MKSLHYHDDGTPYFNDLEELENSNEIQDLNHPDYKVYKDDEPRIYQHHDIHGNSDALNRLHNSIVKIHPPRTEKYGIDTYSDHGEVMYQYQLDQYEPLNKIIRQYTYFPENFTEVDGKPISSADREAYRYMYHKMDGLFSNIPYLNNRHSVQTYRTMFLDKADVKKLIKAVKENNQIHFPGSQSTSMQPWFPSRWASSVSKKPIFNKSKTGTIQNFKHFEGKVPVVLEVKARHGLPLARYTGSDVDFVAREFLLHNPIIHNFRMIPKLVTYSSPNNLSRDTANLTSELINPENHDILKALTFQGEQK